MKIKPFLKKHIGDMVVGLSLLSLSFGLMVYFLWPASTADLYAVVYRKKSLLFEVALASNDQTFLIDQDGIKMKIKLLNHKIGVEESDCANQFCVHQGYISSPRQSIICAPNEVYVYIEDRSNGTEVTSVYL